MLHQNRHMRLFKKIALGILAFIAVSILGGYFYFDHKFSPPANYLAVSGIAQNVPLKWDSDEKGAVYLPVRISGIDRTFYMQFDSGSPVTLFYGNALESIRQKYPTRIKVFHEKISLDFTLGAMAVSSQKFQVMAYGEKIDFGNNASIDVIGTIGTDLLEKRIAILDFKQDVCSFLTHWDESGSEQMEFKKRRILFPASIQNQDLKLLYDSGSSAYELITNKEEWAQYRSKGEIKTENGNSWGNVLKVISAPAKREIEIGQARLKLTQVTYIEGTSQLQNWLMKSSGMQGMVGNRLFLSHKLVLDCANGRFKVE